MRLRRASRVEEWVPSLHKLSRRIAFNDLADDHLIGHSHRLHLSTGPMGVAAASLQFIFYAATITILLGPFGQSDRIPNRLSACIDHNAVELSCGRFASARMSPSASCGHDAALALGRNVPKGHSYTAAKQSSFFEHVVGEGYELRRDIRSQECRTFATASPTAAIVALRSSVEAGEFVR
jgi:hypothetical protein